MQVFGWFLPVSFEYSICESILSARNAFSSIKKMFFWTKIFYLVEMHYSCLVCVLQMWSSNPWPWIWNHHCCWVVGLQSWVNCVRLSGCYWCPTLWICLVTVFDGICFRVSLHVSPALANGFRVSGCLSSLVSLYLSPSLAFDG